MMAGTRDCADGDQSVHPDSTRDFRLSCQHCQPNAHLATRVGLRPDIKIGCRMHMLESAMAQGSLTPKNSQPKDSLPDRRIA